MNPIRDFLSGNWNYIILYSRGHGPPLKPFFYIIDLIVYKIWTKGIIKYYYVIVNRSFNIFSDRPTWKMNIIVSHQICLYCNIRFSAIGAHSDNFSLLVKHLLILLWDSVEIYVQKGDFTTRYKT